MCHPWLHLWNIFMRVKDKRNPLELPRYWVTHTTSIKGKLQVWQISFENLLHNQETRLHLNHDNVKNATSPFPLARANPNRVEITVLVGGNLHYNGSRIKRQRYAMKARNSLYGRSSVNWNTSK